jgi:hypothetical protein
MKSITVAAKFGKFMTRQKNAEKRLVDFKAVGRDLLLNLSKKSKDSAMVYIHQ